MEVGRTYEVGAVFLEGTTDGARGGWKRSAVAARAFAPARSRTGVELRPCLVCRRRPSRELPRAHRLRAVRQLDLRLSPPDLPLRPPRDLLQVRRLLRERGPRRADRRRAAAARRDRRRARTRADWKLRPVLGAPLCRWQRRAWCAVPHGAGRKGRQDRRGDRWVKLRIQHNRGLFLRPSASQSAERRPRPVFVRCGSDICVQLGASCGTHVRTTAWQ